MYLTVRRWKGSKDETGKRYGLLTVLGAVSTDRYGYTYECRCDCGELTVVKGIHLRSANGTKSCGCIRGKDIKHGMTLTREYITWKSMKARCNDPNHPAADYYSERGITYDPAWESFEQFYADMGERPMGTTLDRRDNDLGYSKANCRWATAKEQANNRRPAGTVRGATCLS